MFNDDRDAGRGLEFVVGIITTIVSLITLVLLFMLVTEASLSVASLGGGLILLVICFWFSRLSYRLLLNKPRNKGALLSNGAIKFWCGVFGLCSLLGVVFGLISADVNLLISSFVMLGSCVVGWRLANKRSGNIKDVI